MAGFLRCFDDLLAMTDATEVHEVGCGEGALSIHLARLGKKVRGSDFSSQIIARADVARRQAGITADVLAFEAADIYGLQPEKHAAPLVVCCEVLEHLENPREALAVLARLARPHLLVSVPREPVWKVLNVARGKYLTRLGNTPGHIQAWTRKGFFKLLVAGGFEIVTTRSPFPWTMALCTAPRRSSWR